MINYDKHVFFCLNERLEDKKCCGNAANLELLNYAKTRLKALALTCKNIRINKAGCLGKCELGPLLVIYPDSVWYKYETIQDIDEIIDQHLQNNRVIPRLQLTQ